MTTTTKKNPTNGQQQQNDNFYQIPLWSSESAWWGTEWCPAKEIIKWPQNNGKKKRNPSKNEEKSFQWRRKQFSSYVFAAAHTEAFKGIKKRSSLPIPAHCSRGSPNINDRFSSVSCNISCQIPGGVHVVPINGGVGLETGGGNL